MEIGPFRLGELAIIITLLGGFWALIRTVNRQWTRVMHLFEDILGTEARPGVPAKPGIVERQATLEQRLEEHLKDHEKDAGAG